MKFINAQLNQITMYRLIVYYLIGLLVAAGGLSVLRVLPYDVFALLFEVGFLIAVCWITNKIFASAFNVPTNVESVYISALILALIITPPTQTSDLWFLFWAGVLAMASKFIVAINRKHLFNPVAFAVALTAFTINQTATWWVGNAPLFVFVVIGGVLIVHKIRRYDLVLAYLMTTLIASIGFAIFRRDDLMNTLIQTIVYSPMVFFACVILTEPLTTPPTHTLQVIYGAIVGFLFTPQFHLGSFYFTPELAIVIGNVFSYLVSPKAKLMLALKEKIQVAPDIWDFIFVPNQKFAFAPGQYMEWTLGHDDPDSRGNRRYFTLASAPTENQLRLGVKFYPNSSSFKKSMLAMKPGSEILAAQLAGDFTLPMNAAEKCVFIAGGIGITPFRSMIQMLLDKRERRAIVLFYSNRFVSDIVYKDVFDRAQRSLGIKTIYTLTDKTRIPAGWGGKVGYIDSKMIRTEVPDYRDYTFYISGPNTMVESTRETLLKMGVLSSQIKTDFFPGLA
jgi:ferredoxin-NADP reductase